VCEQVSREPVVAESDITRAHPICAELRGRLVPAGAHGDDESDAAVAIVLRSGYRYKKVAIFGISADGEIVRVHDLNDEGRRVYILVAEIAAIEGGLDE
jgi:hypothetical protein